MSAHWSFIIAAYLIAAAALLATVAAILLDHRALKRQLDGLERRGVARRSAAAP